MKISVIIPAYNIENYISKALDSLLASDFDDYEVIIVDDGSVDRTGEIADSYARHYPHVSVIHQKNSGAPAARNAAMETASGKYVFFMDGDDTVEKNMLREMFDLAESSACQLVVAGFYIDTYTSDDSYFEEKKSAGSFSGGSELFRKRSVELFDNNLLYPPWNKLFSLDRLKKENIRFRQVRWDDFPFVVDYIRDLESACVTDRAYYHFTRQRAESETARYFPGMFDKRREEHTMLLELFDHWGMSDDPGVKEFLARRYVERLFGCVENVTCKASGLSVKEKLGQIRRFINDGYCRESLRYCRPRTTMVKIMLIPFRMKSAGLTYLMGGFISFVKRNFTGVFARLKAGR